MPLFGTCVDRPVAAAADRTDEGAAEAIRLVDGWTEVVGNLLARGLVGKFYSGVQGLPGKTWQPIEN